jgi:hypothetical protein
MSVSHQIRRAHKWLTLFAAIQLLLWLGSGVYMVVMDIDFIHGDSLVVVKSEPINTEKLTLTLDEVLVRYPNASQLHLFAVHGVAYYRLTVDGETLLLNAITGQVPALLTQTQAMASAQSYYLGEELPTSATLYLDEPPAEISPRLLPVWQVNFSPLNTSLYLNASTGALVSKRHDYWRLFDIMWMLHIMDYDTRNDIHNPLLSIMALLALLTALAGIALTYISFRAAPISADNLDDKLVSANNKEGK